MAFTTSTFLHNTVCCSTLNAYEHCENVNGKFERVKAKCDGSSWRCKCALLEIRRRNEMFGIVLHTRMCHRYKCMCLFISYAHFCIVVSNEIRDEISILLFNTKEYHNTIQDNGISNAAGIEGSPFFFASIATNLKDGTYTLLHTYFLFKHIQIYANWNVMNQFNVPMACHDVLSPGVCVSFCRCIAKGLLYDPFWFEISIFWNGIEFISMFYASSEWIGFCWIKFERDRLSCDFIDFGIEDAINRSIISDRWKEKSCFHASFDFPFVAEKIQIIFGRFFECFAISLA